jgi:hypothetical protein
MLAQDILVRIRYENPEMAPLGFDFVQHSPHSTPFTFSLFLETSFAN